jgi:hypothetical protein
LQDDKLPLSSLCRAKFLPFDIFQEMSSFAPNWNKKEGE